jgi:hypothetical protein
MNPGVCSTSALDSRLPAFRQATQSLFELALDCPFSGLNLETGKVSAVVFDPRGVTRGAALSGDLCYTGY